MKKIMLALLPVFLIAAAYKNSKPVTKSNAADPVVNATVKTRIDATLKYFVDSNKTVGISALIFEKGKEVYYNNFGYADREAKVRMNRNTIVRI
jgi:CubicO group peptidase (beta-lactamase class C family)